MPLNSEYVKGLVNYVQFIKKSDVLAGFIAQEDEDLAITRSRIPKAKTDYEYDSGHRILRDKLLTNISEDFDELNTILEVWNLHQNKTPQEDMIPYQIRMEYDLWEILNNKIQTNNYFIRKDTKRYLTKVHKYLISKLRSIDNKQVESFKLIEEVLHLEYVNGVLFIKGNPIKIVLQKRSTAEDKLLKYLFNDKNSWTKPFNYSELSYPLFNEPEYQFNEKKSRKYRDICERINSKIIQTLGESAPLFLIATNEKSGSLTINKAFLEYLT